jgi:hypothetical protein
VSNPFLANSKEVCRLIPAELPVTIATDLFALIFLFPWLFIMIKQAKSLQFNLLTAAIMSVYYQFYIVKDKRIKLLSVVSVGFVLTFLFISPTVTLAFASPFTAMSNQMLTQNDAGVTILEGATLIDGTGALPKPNTTIVIDENRIVFVSNNTDLNFSAAVPIGEKISS